MLIGADHGAPAHVVLLDANDEVIFRVHRQLSSMHTVPSIGDNVLQNTMGIAATARLSFLQSPQRQVGVY